MSIITMATLLTTLFTARSSMYQNLHIRQQIRLMNNPHLAQNPDLVLNLPGLNFSPNFLHYSGFLPGLNDVHLNYWFFESQTDPDNDPVVLWLNGGPGCSSLIGALAENGPFRINENLIVEYNPNTWNLRINMLYIESPAQVGFSYKLDLNYTTNDFDTARNNQEAIKNFFKKFPHLIENDFYLTGESYAGIYIPMLGKLMLQENFPKNLKGFAIGNGLLDMDLNLNSQFYYFYYHGIIDDKMWNSLIHNCKCNQKQQQSSNNEMMKCNFISEYSSNKCNESMSLIHIFLDDIDLNFYNINSECHPMSLYHTLDQLNESSEKIKKRILPLPCGMDGKFVTKWINQNNVKRSLHVPEEIIWSFCNIIDYERQCQSTKNEISFLIQSGLKGLIYNGDLDAVCNFLGVEWFIEELQLPLKKNYTVWMYGGQIGGFLKKYGRNSTKKIMPNINDVPQQQQLQQDDVAAEIDDSILTYATIRGAGHLAIADKPSETRYLFYDFLNLT